MEIKQLQANRFFLTIVLAISTYTSYSQTLPDTTFNDITGEYKITLPSITEFVQWQYATIWNFKVAIIPLEMVDKKAIDWKQDTGGSEHLHKSELVFQKEMLNCSGGYFQGTEGPNFLQAQATNRTTYCRTKYCRRTEASGYEMGTSHYTDYISFSTYNSLIVFKFNYTEDNCLHGLSEPAEHELIMQCKRDKRRCRIVIDAFINLVTEQLRITKI